MYRKTKTAALIVEKRIFWILVTLILMLLGLYGLFVSSSIINVIVREEIEQEIGQTQARISELEFTYIKKKNTINLQLAHSLGFEAPLQQLFVSRRSSVSSRLTLGDEI